MLVVDMGPAGWRSALEVLRGGGLVGLPTDTVYGIACDPYNELAIARVYQAKGRSLLKALPLLLSGADRLAQVSRGVPAQAAALAEAFWPGALTLVVPRRRALPSALGGGDTIAVRVPDHDQLRALIADFGGVVAATSANLSGSTDAVDAQQTLAYLGSAIDLVVDGGRTRGGIPSTVVDCTVEPAAVLRRGAVAEAEILRVLAAG